ncbi:MAG: hypothetical protein AAGJ85_07705 [Pseudomonadota bacterium]
MSSPANIQRSVAALIAVSLVGACASTGGGTAETGADAKAYEQAMLDAMAPATAEEIAAAERSDPLTRANFWAQEFQKDQANPATALAFMRSLRAIGSHDRVIEVGSSILPFQPDNYEILLEVGRSLLANNQPEAAAQALVRSADFSPPTEAAPLAALGLAFDRMEQHGLAQEAYREALKREPARISTLSNYGLSLALSGRLSEAERQLRLAAGTPGADARVRQNLALVLGLQGKFDEMTTVDPSAPRRTIEANRSVLRQMILPARSYEALADADPVEMSAPITLPRSPVETMPDVEEAEVSETAMSDPVTKPTVIDAPETALIGEPEQAEKPKLRSRLRGTTG